MLNKSLMLLMLQIGALELHLVPLLVTTFDHPDQADQLDKLDKLRKNLKTSRNLISLKNWPTWPTWLTWPTKLTNLEKLTNLKNLTKMLNPTWARPWPTSPDLPPAIAILISFQSSLLLGNFPFNLFCCWEIRKKVCNPLGDPPPHTVLPILTSNTSSIHNITFQLTDFQKASLHCIFHEILLQNWLPERQQWSGFGRNCLPDFLLAMSRCLEEQISFIGDKKRKLFHQQLSPLRLTQVS